MNLLLFGLLPLVVFAVIDWRGGLRGAVFAAVLCSLLELIALYGVTGRPDSLSLIGTALFIAFGAVSLRFNDPLYFKLQPAVLYLFTALFLGCIQIFGGSAAARYMPLVQSAMPEILIPYTKTPEFPAMMNRIFNLTFFALLLNAAVVGYAAMKCSRKVWLLANIAGLWAAMAIVLVAAVLI